MALPALYANDPILDKDRYDEDEYFTLEESSRARWEFLPDGPAPFQGSRLGRIRAMSVGTLDHGAIAMNFGRALGNALSSAGVQACRTFGSDVKVHATDGRNTFPDISVVCGKPEMYRNRRDTVTNPVLIAEVLSPPTESDDRGDKWASYQSIPSLRHYLLLAADRVRIELCTREESGWHFETWETLDSEIPLRALGITVTAADLYAMVDFEAENFTKRD